MDKSVFKMKNDSTISLFDAAEAIRRELVNKGKAELVEKIIDDLSRQVLDERKKWSEMFDYFRSKRTELRKERHDAIAALHRLQLAFATYQRYLYEKEIKLCEHDNTDPANALKERRFWTKVRNGLSYRELIANKGTQKCKTNTNKV